MKFTDGNWMLRAGVRTFHPAQAYDVRVSKDALTVIAPTKRIANRGATLDGPLLTARFFSPLPDVIGVRLTHFSGEQERGPHFPLHHAHDHIVTVEGGESAGVLTSGRLSVHVEGAESWGVTFEAEGRTLTKSGPKAMGYALVENQTPGGEQPGPYMHEQLALGVGECVYGLGERFTAFVKNGQVVETWNKDGGTGSDQAYKSVPFYLTNRGYGVFVNQPEDVSFEVASEKVSRVQFSVPGQSLEYYVIYGPTPKEILAKYTQLTGRAALPPAWSFGLWLTTSFTTSYDEQTVTGFIQGMADRDLPLHVFHFDCFWMRSFHWSDFEWDSATFPDPPAMLRRLKERGLHICVWINPYIAQLSPLFEEGRRNHYLLRKPNGDVWQTDQWQAGMGIVDFTNPEACAWYAGKLHALCDMGVDSFKTDFGERIPTDVVYYDGSDPRRMHNFYPYLYNKVVFDVLCETRGEGEAAVFARSATAGGQQFPVHWGGDCYSNFESMAESLRGGLSLCLSGFGFWSHDIGGFEGTPPAEVYKRWIAFGLLSSHSRLHGSSSYRVPWLSGDEAVDTLRFFTKLKCRLMPYLFACAVLARDTGAPVMRAMLLEFPDDPACDYLDRQYLLGESLLVAPVFSADDTVSYYVPAGKWTAFLTGETIVGPGWQRETHGFLSLPLLVRANTLLPVGSKDDRPDYDYADGVTLRLYALEEGHAASATVPTLSGEPALTVTAQRSGGQIEVTAQGGEDGQPETWQVVLVGTASVASVEGGTFADGDGGALITPAQGTKRLLITLS